MIEIILSALLLLFLSFSALPSYSEEIVIGQETTTNYLPSMSEFTRSGTTSLGTGSGCPSGSFCTSGTQGPGGTFSSTFDLQDSMSLNDINRGFKLDYSVDVTSHPSNSTLASCVDGNVLQGSDCRDIFSVALSLFSAGNVLEHRFEDEIELDFNGLRNFTFEQNIPANEFTELKGGFDLFGIDAGFPSGFFGPHFSNPSLVSTFDLVTFIETDVIDIIRNVDIVSENPITNVEVNLAPPPPEPEVVEAEIEIEAQFEHGIQLAAAEIAPPQPAEFSSASDAQEQTSQQIEVEVESQIEQEIENTEPEVAEPEPEVAEPEPEVAEPERAEANEPEPEEPAAEKEQKPKITVKKAVKEKIAKQIIKKMGDTGRYDSTNQIRTLVVMQVLGNSKSFFKSTSSLQDKEGFFNNVKVPDASISDNNFAQYLLIGRSSKQHDNLVNLQWRK